MSLEDLEELLAPNRAPRAREGAKKTPSSQRLEPWRGRLSRGPYEGRRISLQETCERIWVWEEEGFSANGSVHTLLAQSAATPQPAAAAEIYERRADAQGEISYVYSPPADPF